MFPWNSVRDPSAHSAEPPPPAPLSTTARLGLGAGELSARRPCAFIACQAAEERSSHAWPHVAIHTRRLLPCTCTPSTCRAPARPSTAWCTRCAWDSPPSPDAQPPGNKLTHGRRVAEHASGRRDFGAGSGELFPSPTVSAIHTVAVAAAASARCLFLARPATLPLLHTAPQD